MASIWLVPDSKNPSSKRPDPFGALLSMVGMGLLLWGIIEAPNRTWESPLVLGALGGAALVLGAFVVWERRSDHPLLELSFFGSRRFSAAMGSMALVLFALAGVLFLLTQYLQFSLGYSALQAGLRIGPLALILLVVAPTSSLLARWLGTKPIVATGMATIAVGLWLLSRITVAGTYGSAVPAFLLLGIGTGLAFAPSTESVMGSLPRTQAGTGSATNSTALQLGGALGVGVLGSLLASRYQGRMDLALAHQPVPASVLHVINGSLGGALAVAQHVGGTGGTALAEVARQSFMSGMDLAMTVGAVAVAAGAMVVLAVLPSRAERAPEPSTVVGSLRSQAPEALLDDAVSAQRERRQRKEVSYVAASTSDRTKLVWRGGSGSVGRCAVATGIPRAIRPAAASRFPSTASCWEMKASARDRSPLTILVRSTALARTVAAASGLGSLRAVIVTKLSRTSRSQMPPPSPFSTNWTMRSSPTAAWRSTFAGRTSPKNSAASATCTVGLAAPKCSGPSLWLGSPSGRGAEDRHVARPRIHGQPGSCSTDRPGPRARSGSPSEGT